VTFDTYRDVQAETYYSNQTYKHILLPVWLCTYFYKQKKYKFLINGQTGKIYGKKPVSAVKVVIAVLIILAIIIAIIFFVQQQHGVRLWVLIKWFVIVLVQYLQPRGIILPPMAFNLVITDLE